MANNSRAIYAALVIGIALTLIVFREPLRDGLMTISNNSTETVTSEASVSEAAETPLYSAPVSRWLENERTRALGQLKDQRSDIVVVPFQVQGHGLDATARSLMTLSLAYRINTGTTLSVADPILVAKALGSNSRVFSEATIAQVAESVGATQILVSEAGHDQDGHYNIRVRVARLTGPTTIEFDDTKAYVESGIPFDAERPPYFSFLERRDRIVSDLVSNSLSEPVLSGSDLNSSFPLTLNEMMDFLRSSPLSAAHHLQFLGVLHPEATSDRSREMLFERSLVMLEYVDPESDSYDLLRARALLLLNRRPAALIMLGTADDLPTQTLQAFADGNLEVATSNAAIISSSMEAIVATVLGERLRLAYYRPQDDELLQSLAEIDAVWGPLVHNAATDSNYSQPTSTTSLKASLDEAFPIDRFSYSAFSTRQAIAGDEPDDYALAIVIIGHLDHIEQKSNFLHPLSPRTTDYTDLIRNMLAANVVHRGRHAMSFLGRPQRAIEIADRFAPVFAGHPALTLMKSRALAKLSKTSSEIEKENLKDQMYELGRLGFWWSGRLTPMTVGISRSRHFLFPKYSDISDAEAEMLTYASDWPRPAVAAYGGSRESRVLTNRQCLANTISNLQCFSDLHNDLFHSEHYQPEAKVVFDENKHRFVGHPQRLNFLAEVAAKSEGSSSAETMYSDAVEDRSLDWEPYEKLAFGLLRDSKFEEALEAALRYPGFQGESTVSPVALSNQAESIGSRLYWAGAYEQAQALYQISASSGTGSGAEMISNIRLALIDGDIDTAIYHSLQRAQRYGSKYAIRDLMGLASFVGRTDSAMEIIQSVHNMFDEPELWAGALVAQRSTNMDSSEITEWAFAEGRPDLSATENHLPLRHIFLSQVIDRTPATQLAGDLRQLDPRDPPIKKGGGSVWKDGRPMRSPPYFPVRSSLEVVVGAGREPVKLDSRLVVGAEALASIYEGDFQSAFDTLDTASDYYDLREFLPFYAWAAAKVRNTARLDAYMATAVSTKERMWKQSRTLSGNLFDEYLALAFVHGVKGDHAEAINHLRKANADVLHNGARYIYTRYQILETARLLYLDTKHQGYRQFALDLARRYAIIEPYQSYSHSFVAMLSDRKSERVAALARVLVLDPQSRCLDTANSNELAEAQTMADAGHHLPADGTSSTM